MRRKPTVQARPIQPYRYASPHVPLAAIRRFARQIAERFHPERVILFGSYAYGKPHAESDVDLLVVMPCRDVVCQSIRIGLALERPFSHDLIVRTPKQIERGLKDDNWFLREIVERGKVLYEARDRQVDQEGGGRLGRRARPGRSSASAARSGVLSLPAGSRKVPQGGSARPRPTRAETHDLEDLLDLLLPNDGSLAPLRRGLRTLTRYAVEYRYPGEQTTKRGLTTALKQAERIRREVRTRLGFPP